MGLLVDPQKKEPEETKGTYENCPKKRGWWGPAKTGTDRSILPQQGSNSTGFSKKNPGLRKILNPGSMYWLFNRIHKIWNLVV